MIGLLVTPSRYFDVTSAGKRIRAHQKATKKASEKRLTETPKIEEDSSPLEIGKQSSEEDNTGKHLKKEELSSLNEGESDDDIDNVDMTFCQRLCSLAGNKNYLRMCFSLSILYFVITGL